ncbi:lysylphosphatidylglycerol synthase transmembrane domain-containing protein [Pseudokineococcus marinus]|uniref:Flippase-like domain-containing protein n=1 Tax=Pseudokineococcus marinus TaxID=351215 RepID=A0A849BSR7_9ACTN|nr:lysylphosphatidylglycerol synthase transmembrane domain-containing protein [Pseudokineococcus marinus]NNH23504.1 flippase-like domain-containing protein [Pseudokineococcus marinus]
MAVPPAVGPETDRVAEPPVSSGDVAAERSAPHVRRRWRAAGALLGAALGVLALSLVVRQLGSADPLTALRQAHPGWLALTAVAAVVPFAGATATVMAFSPVPLRLRPTAAVQVAGTFLNLLGPAGLGGMALNVRYLYRRGASTPAAVASVLAIQVVSVLVTALVLVAAVLSSGRTASGVRLLPDEVTLLTVLSVVVAALGTLLVPRLRRAVVARLRAPAGRALAVLRDLARHPARLGRGALGSGLVTGGFLAALGLSLRAYGADVPLLELAVVLFAGTAVGSVFPTPGGIGTVEAAIAAGLVAVGVDPVPAVLASVTYRVATLWLWVLPGWLLAVLLRRAGHV